MFDNTDPANSTVILFTFDNSIYVGKVDGLQMKPVKMDSWYHILGKLEIVDAKRVKELF